MDGWVGLWGSPGLPWPFSSPPGLPVAPFGSLGHYFPPMCISNIFDIFNIFSIYYGYIRGRQTCRKLPAKIFVRKETLLGHQKKLPELTGSHA